MGLFENATQDLNYKATEIDTSNLTQTQFVNSNSIGISTSETEEIELDDNQSFNTYIEEIDDFSGNQYGEHTINKYLDIYADLDGDGSFTIMDKTLLQKYLSDGTEIKNNNLLFKIGDLDGDGKVTIADLSYIEKYEASGEFPVNNITVANRLDTIKYSNIKTQTENDLSEKYKKLQLIENTIGYYNYSKELQDRQDNSRESRIVKNKEKGYHHYLNKEKNNQSNANNSKPFGANEAAERKNYFYNYYKNNKLSAEEEKAIIEEYGSLEAARDAYETNIASLNYSKKQLDKQIKLIPYNNTMNTADFKKWANTKTLDDFDPTKNSKLGNISKYMDSYKYLDASQLAMYNYLLETQGEAEANKFLDIYEDDINQAIGLERANDFINKLDKNFEKIIKEDGTLMDEKDIEKLQSLLDSNSYNQIYDMDGNGVLDNNDLDKLKQYIDVGGKIETTLNNLGITFTGGFQDGWNKFFEGFKYIFDDSSVLSAEEYKMMFIAQKLEQNGTIKGSYEFGQTVGNMVPVIMASAIATAATAPFGGEGGAAVFGTSLSAQQIGQITAATLIFSSTFGNSKHQALCNGHSLESAIGYGFLSGVSEAGLETLLGSLPFVGTEAKNVFVAMYKEGLSESAQELVGSMIGYYTLGEEIDVTELSAGMGKAFIFGALLSGAGNGLTSGMKIVINGVKYKLTSSQIMAYYEASIDPKTGESNGLTLQEFVQKNVEPSTDTNNTTDNNLSQSIKEKFSNIFTRIKKAISGDSNSVWFNKISSSNYKQTIDGITFVSDSQNGLNSLTQYYYNLKNSGNGSSSFFLNELSNKGLYVTNISNSSNSGAFCLGNCVYLDGNTISNNIFTTFYHETGHFYDGYVMYDTFRPLYEQEIQKIGNLGQAQLDAVVNTFLTDFNTVENEFSNYFNSYYNYFYNDFMSKNPNYNKMSAKKQKYLWDNYVADQKNIYMRNSGYAAVSDILDAVTNGELYKRGGYGHGTDYFDSYAESNYKEVLANISDLYNSGNTDILYKYLPKDVCDNLIHSYESMTKIERLSETIDALSYSQRVKYGSENYIDSIVEYLRTDDITLFTRDHNFRSFMGSLTREEIITYLTSTECVGEYFDRAKDLIDNQYGNGYFKSCLEYYMQSGDISVFPNEGVRNFVQYLKKDNINIYLGSLYNY